MARIGLLGGVLVFVIGSVAGCGADPSVTAPDEAVSDPGDPEEQSIPPDTNQALGSPAGRVYANLARNEAIPELEGTESLIVTNLADGVVLFRVKHLPEDVVSHRILPVTLTDDGAASPGSQVAQHYSAWLLDVSSTGVIQKAMIMGKFHHACHHGRVDFRAGDDPRNDGFNEVVMTAERDDGDNFTNSETVQSAAEWLGRPHAVIFSGRL